MIADNFGDVNDYRKYGLLRSLVRTARLPLGVCWLLTPDDGRSDGEFRGYLEQPTRWRKFDPELYDKLLSLREPGVSRSVENAEKWELLPSAKYFDPVVSDNPVARKAYFAEAVSRLDDCPLIFFDPDNGIEVRSVSEGSRGSSKYLYWREIERTYAAGHSLVIYQHFARTHRLRFTAMLASELQRRLSAPLIDSFATAHVVFFLVAQPEHKIAFLHAHEDIALRWTGQIEPLAHVEGVIDIAG